VCSELSPFFNEHGTGVMQLAAKHTDVLGHALSALAGYRRHADDHCDLHPVVYRSDGEVGADSTMGLAAGCHGRPNPGIRSHPRGYDGYRRCGNGHEVFVAVRAGSPSDAVSSMDRTCDSSYGATIGLVQNDIKRVLAFSTVSQLGYMFLACGVGNFTAGMFHVTTHGILQSALVPRFRRSDPFDAWRTGHAQDGWAEEADPENMGTACW